MWQRVWRFLFLSYVRPVFKWILRMVTGKCELQRILASTERGAKRTLRIEKSLKHSKCRALKELLVDDDVNVEEAVEVVMKVKVIMPEIHTDFRRSMTGCLYQIYGYRQLLQQLEISRKIQYSSDNVQHEELLMQLWEKLCPEVKLESRISKQWGDIGFQGDDPMTDFRGMGMLGLHNLIYLVTNHTDTARQLLSHSLHPQYGYSFAIAGINITALAYTLMLRNHLKTHFYNTVYEMPQLEHFHRIYCHLFCDFVKFWRDEKPEDIMQFNVVKQKYEKNIIHILRTDKSASLKGKYVESL